MTRVEEELDINLQGQETTPRAEIQKNIEQTDKNLKEIENVMNEIAKIMNTSDEEGDFMG